MLNPLLPAILACILIAAPAAAQPANRASNQTIAALDDAITDLSALQTQINAARARGETAASLNGNQRFPWNPCTGATIPSWRACVQQVDAKVRRISIDVSRARAIQADLGRLDFSIEDAQSTYTDWLAALARLLRILLQERDGVTQNLKD